MNKCGSRVSDEVTRRKTCGAAYAKAKAALDRVTGATLDANHISGDEAMRGEVIAPPKPFPAAGTP